jgi:hypothetical protein
MRALMSRDTLESIIESSFSLNMLSSKNEKTNQAPITTRKTSKQNVVAMTKDNRNNYLPFYYDSLLVTLYKLSEKKESDLDLFYFIGSQSGIILPPLQNKWPSSSGYSFMTWFKMESLKRGADEEYLDDDFEDNDGTFILISFVSMFFFLFYFLL